MKDKLSAEMRLIVDGGCHPNCQHMPQCVRYGPICMLVYERLRTTRRARS